MTSLNFSKDEISKNYKNKNHLIFGIIVGLIVVFNIFEWINFTIRYNEKNKKLVKIEPKYFKDDTLKSVNNENKSYNNDNNYEIKAGYRYKKSNGKGSTFTSRNLGYAEKLLNDSTLYDSLKSEYCTIVNEIVKVDNGIMPGTDIPFEKVTYIQVDDAYKEHLQQIAQIRQVFDTIYGNDNDLENGVGCHYTGTHWNNANSQYKAKQFYSSSVTKYLNNHGYDNHGYVIKSNNNNSSPKTKNKKRKTLDNEVVNDEVVNDKVDEVIDNTINYINSLQNSTEDFNNEDHN